MQPYQLTGRIWLTLNDETVLGEGKICLLQLVKELGSLRKAAEEMKMSYRKAWFSVNQINKTAQEPLVVLTRGGKDGGSAQLTEYGLQLLQDFEEKKRAFQAFLDKQNTD